MQNEEVRESEKEDEEITALWESSKTSETRNREFNELSVLDCHGSSS
jgi:hypothetical protein